MMVIMMAREVALEADLAEDAVEADLAADAMDAEDMVAEAMVVMVAMDEVDIMEKKGITQTLTFPAYQTILT